MIQFSILGGKNLAVKQYSHICSATGMSEPETQKSNYRLESNGRSIFGNDGRSISRNVA